MTPGTLAHKAYGADSVRIVLVVLIALVTILPGRGATDTAVRESYAKHDAANWLEHIARMPEAFKPAGYARNSTRGDDTAAEPP